MLQQRHIMMLSILVMSLGVIGCADPAAVLQKDSLSPIGDVPIPSGFSLEEDQSRDWTDGSLRFVDHLYEGNENKFAALRFFEEHMPLSRWELLSTQLLHGRATLDFVKDQEKARVTIYDKPGSWVTVVEVTIWPQNKPDKPLRPASTLRPAKPKLPSTSER